MTFEHPPKLHSSGKPLEKGIYGDFNDHCGVSSSIAAGEVLEAEGRRLFIGSGF